MRYMRYLLPIFALTARADIFIMDAGATTGSIPVITQLPDAPGVSLFDTELAANGPAVCSTSTFCWADIAPDDPSLIPAPIGGTLSFGYPQNGQLVSYTIAFGASSPQSEIYPDWGIQFSLGAFFCNPSICPTITPVTGQLQFAFTIPWYDPQGDLIHTDTGEFIGPAVYTPEPSLFLPVLVLVGAVVGWKKARKIQDAGGLGFFFFPFHLASAPFLATAWRSSAVILVRRALPPLCPASATVGVLSFFFRVAITYIVSAQEAPGKGESVVPKGLAIKQMRKLLTVVRA
jgi:hypothetical protein